MNATAHNQDKGGWLNRLPRLLSAPLLITCVGALLAGILVPRIASQAENHRRALEIQASLVQDMSEAVARVVPVGQLLATRSIKKADINTTAAFNDALLQWERDRASIEARLRAYFGTANIEKAAIPDAWVGYGNAVEDLYYLSTTELPFPNRCQRTSSLKRYLDPGAASPRCPQASWTGKQWGTACATASNRWDVLALCNEDSLKKEGEGYVRGRNYFDAYTAVSAALLRREKDLLNAVRTSTPAGF